MTYSLSAMMLLPVVMALVAATGAPTSGALLLVHLFVQLRQAFRLGFVSTAWRTTALLLVCVLVLTAFATGLIVLG